VCDRRFSWYVEHFETVFFIRDVSISEKGKRYARVGRGTLFLNLNFSIGVASIYVNTGVDVFKELRVKMKLPCVTLARNNPSIMSAIRLKNKKSIFVPNLQIVRHVFSFHDPFLKIRIALS